MHGLSQKLSLSLLLATFTFGTLPDAAAKIPNRPWVNPVTKRSAQRKAVARLKSARLKTPAQHLAALVSEINSAENTQTTLIRGMSDRLYASGPGMSVRTSKSTLAGLAHVDVDQDVAMLLEPVRAQAASMVETADRVTANFSQQPDLPTLMASPRNLAMLFEPSIAALTEWPAPLIQLSSRRHSLLLLGASDTSVTAVGEVENLMHGANRRTREAEAVATKWKGNALKQVARRLLPTVGGAGKRSQKQIEVALQDLSSILNVDGPDATRTGQPEVVHLAERGRSWPDMTGSLVILVKQKSRNLGDLATALSSRGVLNGEQRQKMMNVRAIEANELKTLRDNIDILEALGVGPELRLELDKKATKVSSSLTRQQKN